MVNETSGQVHLYDGPREKVCDERKHRFDGTKRWCDGLEEFESYFFGKLVDCGA